jgi:hypothetical protein
MLDRVAQLSGTHAAGTLQIAQSAMNDALAAIGAGRTPPAIEMQPANTMLVRFGMLHAHATLPPRLEAGASPRLTLRLRSLLVAMALRAAVHQPFIHIHGRQLTIELSAIPAFQEWRELWKFLELAEFETVPGALRIRFSVRVTPEAAHDDA